MPKEGSRGQARGRQKLSGEGGAFGGEHHPLRPFSAQASEPLHHPGIGAMQGEPAVAVLDEGVLTHALKLALQPLRGPAPAPEGGGEAGLVVGRRCRGIKTGAAQFCRHQHHLPALVNEGPQQGEAGGSKLGQP